MPSASGAGGGVDPGGDDRGGDTTGVEVYGCRKRGVAYHHQGQRVGRPHAASWAETGTALAADLMPSTNWMACGDCAPLTR